MLTIKIPNTKLFNEETLEFSDIKETTLSLEHSLISLSKWESKWHTHFLRRKGFDEELSSEQWIDYIRCMTLNKVDNQNVYYAIPESEMERIASYLEDTMTATTFSKEPQSAIKADIITAEKIYYSMIKWNIPVEKFEKWHLNRLFALIEVFNRLENPKKLSKREVMQRNHDLNQARKARRSTARRKP